MSFNLVLPPFISEVRETIILIVTLRYYAYPSFVHFTFIFLICKKIMSLDVATHSYHDFTQLVK